MNVTGSTRSNRGATQALRSTHSKPLASERFPFSNLNACSSQLPRPARRESLERRCRDVGTFHRAGSDSGTSVGSLSGGPACPARHRHPWSVRIQVWVTGIRKSWGPAPRSTVSVTTHRTTAVSATTDPDVGEMQGALINMFPGSKVEAVSKAVPHVKPDGTTGTDLYLSESGQPALPPTCLHPRSGSSRPLSGLSMLTPSSVRLRQPRGGRFRRGG